MSLTLPDLTLERLARFELPPLSQLVDLNALDQVRTRLDERTNGEQVSPVTRDRLDDLRRRLRTMPFAEATNIGAGRERLLLTLYRDDRGEGYMRRFDDGMCQELLGDGTELRLKSRLNQAARLFFAHFDQLPGHAALGRLLCKALAQPEAASHRANDVRAWREFRDCLFATDGPQRFAEQLREGEALSATAERCAVPQSSRYFKLAQHYRLISGIRNLPLGDDATIFDEVVKDRESKFGERNLGAAVLELLIRRSIAENGARVPEKWGLRIAAIGCDPRLRRSDREFNLWWGWALPHEVEVAKSAFTTLCLKGFLRLLRSSLGLNAERMFKRREQFLSAIDDAGKIRDARLVLVADAMREAGQHFPEQALASFARMRRNADGISVICLKLDGFYMIEGTHNFSLRLFRDRNFPIDTFWERDSSRFVLGQFQTGADAQIPHQGRWERTFKIKLAGSPFHISWRDVALW